MPLRIDDGARLRQLRVGLVMVRDDQVDAELAGAQRRLGAADAAIDRDHELHTVGVQPVERRRLQAVAVPQALRDEVDHVAAEKLQRAAQNDCGRDAVHVVVAVHRDAFPLRQRAADPLDGAIHVGQPHRVEQMLERRLEKPRGRLHIAQPADGEQPRRHRRHAELMRQRQHARVVTGIGLPEQRSSHGELRVHKLQVQS